MAASDFWGDPISIYTRKQAIDDGVLVDVSDTEGAGNFKWPVAFTSALFSDVCRGKGAQPETFAARVWDVCYMATRGELHGSDSFFKVIVGAETLELRANCGPGDQGEPVITIGHPEDF